MAHELSRTSADISKIVILLLIQKLIATHINLNSHYIKHIQRIDFPNYLMQAQILLKFFEKKSFGELVYLCQRILINGSLPLLIFPSMFSSLFM